MQVAAAFGEHPFGGDFRFTRVWRQTATAQWQLVAGHISPVQ